MPEAMTIYEPQAVTFDERSYKSEIERAGFYAGAACIPKAYQGKAADCYVICQLADQIRLPAVLVMQEVKIATHGVVQGQLMISAKFLGALAVRAGLKLGYRVEYGSQPIDGFADIRVTAYNKADETETGYADTELAVAEEWTKRNPKYRTMLLQMLKYRALTFLVRAHYPAVAFIASTTTEEAEDLGDGEEPPRASVVSSDGPKQPEGLDRVRADAKAASEPKPEEKPKAPPDPRKEAALATLRDYMRTHRKIMAQVCEADGLVKPEDISRCAAPRLERLIEEVKAAIEAATTKPTTTGPDPRRDRLAAQIAAPDWPIDATAELAAHLGVASPVDPAALTSEQLDSAIAWLDSVSG